MNIILALLLMAATADAGAQAPHGFPVYTGGSNVFVKGNISVMPAQLRWPTKIISLGRGVVVNTNYLNDVLTIDPEWVATKPYWVVTTNWSPTTLPDFYWWWKHSSNVTYGSNEAQDFMRRSDSGVVVSNLLAVFEWKEQRFTNILETVTIKEHLRRTWFTEEVKSYDVPVDLNTLTNR